MLVRVGRSAALRLKAFANGSVAGDENIFK